MRMGKWEEEGKMVIRVGGREGVEVGGEKNKKKLTEE